MAELPAWVLRGDNGQDEKLAQGLPVKAPLPAAGVVHLAPPAHHSHHQVVHASVYLAPKDIYDHIADAGEAKLSNSFLRELVLGLLAGAYIGLGFSLCMLCAGQLSDELRHDQPGLFNLLFGVFGFPMGLTLVVLTGASLFTSNIAYMASAVMEGKAGALGLLRVWTFSYFANLAGALFLTWLMVWGQVFAHREAFTNELALKKVSLGFGTAFVRGILCNWLVCLAVWQANAANDIGGKVLAIFLPISAFVAMGFEHCVANMFAVPMSMHLGSGITTATFVSKNLVPVTLGNIVGGAAFVACMYGLSFGRWEVIITRHVNRAAARALSWLVAAWRGGRRTASGASSPSDRSVDDAPAAAATAALHRACNPSAPARGGGGAAARAGAASPPADIEAGANI